MLKKILNSKSKTVTFSAILLGISAVISGILGLVSDVILAGKFGVGAESNIYFAAFRIPDLVYNLLIVGGLRNCLFADILRVLLQKQGRGVENDKFGFECFFVFTPYYFNHSFYIYACFDKIYRPWILAGK